MKKALLLISLLLFALLPMSVQAANQVQKVTYTVMKNQSHDASIANDYFNKPISLEKQDNYYLASFSVNHGHWITEITLDGKSAIQQQQDKTSEDTVVYTFKLDKLMQEIPATVKVDIEEEVSGEAFSYHNKYPITLKLDLSSQDIDKLNSEPANHYPIHYFIVVMVIFGSWLGYKFMKGGTKVVDK